MSARMQIKLDAEFPRFTERLLEVVYPNYVAPTPSMAVARLFPSRREGKLMEGFCVPRGCTRYPRHLRRGNRLPASCPRSGQDVMLYPLEIIDARLTGIPPDVPSLDRYVPARAQVRGALRLRLRMTGDANIADLKGLDTLPVYLAGR